MSNLQTLYEMLERTEEDVADYIGVHSIIVPKNMSKNWKCWKK